MLLNTFFEVTFVCSM